MTHSLSFKRDINRADNKTITVINMLNIKEKLKSTDSLWRLSFNNHLKKKKKKKTFFFPILAFSVPKI